MMCVHRMAPLAITSTLGLALVFMRFTARREGPPITTAHRRGKQWQGNGGTVDVNEMTVGFGPIGLFIYAKKEPTCTQPACCYRLPGRVQVGHPYLL